ncbi:ATP-binding cassette domain-containing protein [Fodinicurvata sp. EGI_FJ10296]|uniref:ATP-binding cassette domain-containing protein n=1 Tax=Fodinicurvata sp. EGI_FJ10296 TaxID=3231908 RepID=UPI003456DE4B
MTGLILDGAGVLLAGRPVFPPVTRHIGPGEIVVLMGPSGCGKSTLLNRICGTLDPVFTAEGTVSVNGRALDGLPPESRRLGLLFQDDLLFPHLSVGANLAFGVPGGISRHERRARVDAALSEAGLAGFAERDPATLSGGQRSRAALMRTLLADPEALLLDEPFSKLDRDLRQRVRDFVFDHARRRRLPTLLVTHDPEDATDSDGTDLPTMRMTGER